MMLHVPEVLSAEVLTQVRDALHASLSTSEWTQGAASAGQQAKQNKQNRQLTAGTPAGGRLGGSITAALEHHPLFVSAALPRQVLPPLFNCYDGGGHYGNHVDNAIQRGGDSLTKVRTDVSVTVFVSRPDEYDGGELIVEDTYGEHAVKLPAGDMVLYPSTSLHRVEPISRGSRVASFFWIQSMVRDDGKRSLLLEMDAAIRTLAGSVGDRDASIVSLTGTYHNLLRRWADC
jgi:PKHD-type hydroxylase